MARTAEPRKGSQRQPAPSAGAPGVAARRTPAAADRRCETDVVPPVFISLRALALWIRTSFYLWPITSYATANKRLYKYFKR